MKMTFKTGFTWAVLLICAFCLFPAGAVFAGQSDGGETLKLLPLLGFGGLIDMFETRSMLDAVDQMKRPGTFLRDLFFPEFKQFETKTVDVDIIKGKRRMAPFVSPQAPGRAVENRGSTTDTLAPGYLKPKFETTSEMLLNRRPGEVLYAGQQTPQSRAEEKLASDLAELMDMCSRREEWQAAQALNGGVVTMTLKGETEDKIVTVDFNMDASHKVTLTGTDLWSDQDNSDPLSDLADFSVIGLKDSGLLPTDVAMAGDVANAFITHPKVKDELNVRKMETGIIKPETFPNGVTYIGTISRPGLNVDVWSYHEWFVDEDTDTEGAAIPDGKLFMGSRHAKNTKLYAAIQDVEAIESGMVATDRFPKSWVTKDPSVRWLMMQSAPLMALNQPDAFVVATVLGS